MRSRSALQVSVYFCPWDSAPASTACLYCSVLYCTVQHCIVLYLLVLLGGGVDAPLLGLLPRLRVGEGVVLVGVGNPPHLDVDMETTLKHRLDNRYPPCRARPPLSCRASPRTRRAGPSSAWPGWARCPSRQRSSAWRRASSCTRWSSGYQALELSTNHREVSQC